MGIDVVRGQGREGAAGLQREVDTELLVEKEQTIHELRETVEILESKVPPRDARVRGT